MANLAEADAPAVQLWVPWCFRCDAPMGTFSEPGFEGMPPRSISFPTRTCRACGATALVSRVPWVAVG